MRKLYICVLMMILACAPTIVGAASIEVMPAVSDALGRLSVEVTVSESEIYAGSLNLVYDTDLLEPVSVTKGSALAGCYSSSVLHYKRSEKHPDTVRINWSGTNSPVSEGVMCTVVFDVLTDEKLTDMIFADEAVLCDYDGKSIDAELVEGKIYLNGIFSEMSLDAASENMSGADIMAANGGKSELTLDLYIAYYNADDTFKKVNKVPVILPSGGIFSVSEVIVTDGGYAKLMLWENNTLAPLSLAESTK